MEHILTTKGTMPKPEIMKGASIPEYIEIKATDGSTVAFLSPEADGVEAWIDDEQNGSCTIEIELPTENEKWQYLTDKYRIYADGKEFVILNPDAVDKQRDGKKLTGKIKAHESWVLLGKKYQTISNDPQTPSPPWGAVIIVSGGAAHGGFDPGSAGSALSYLLQSTGWTVGTVDVTGTFDLETEKESVLYNINQVQEKWGGILVWDSVNHTVSLRDEETWQNYTGYQIRYAKNLKGISRADDYDIVTRLYPFGENDLNIANVNGGLLYLDNQSYSTEVLEGVWYNQDIADQTQLKTQGEKQLAVMCRPRHNYKTEVLDLRSLPGYGHETFKRSDMADLFDEDFGVNAQVRIIRYRHNVFQPWLCDMELGDPIEKIQATVAQTVLMAKFYKNVVKPNESFQNLLKAVINTAATEINGASGDYKMVDGVSTWFDRDSVTGELTGKLLRITPQGLIISYDGGQTWKLAISGEGIHADAGWVGKLSAGMITVGADTTFEDGYDPTEAALGGIGVGEECTALFHFDGYLLAHNGLTPSFTRNSAAYLSDGAQVSAGQPRLEKGRFGKGLMIEEGTTNLLDYNTNFPIWPSAGNIDTLTTRTSRNSFKVAGTASVPGSFAYIYPTFATSNIHHSFSCKVKNNNNKAMRADIVIKDGQNGANISNQKSYSVQPGQSVCMSASTHTAVSSSCATFSLLIYCDSTDGTVNAEIFEAQGEAKPRATSFIDGTRAGEALAVPSPQQVLDFSKGTISLWFKPAPAFWNGSYNRIVGHATAMNTNELSLTRSDTSSKLICYASNASSQWSGGSYSALASTTELIADNWYHLAFTWQSGGKLALFVNGIKEGEISYDKPPSVYGIFAIGHHPDSSEHYANGIIDELAIFDYVATNDEVKKWHDADKPFYSPLEMQTAMALAENKLDRPGYVEATADGFKVFDPNSNLRSQMGTWLDDGGTRKYGIRVIDGVIEADTFIVDKSAGGLIDMIYGFGDGSDGDLSSSATISVPDDDKYVVIKQYNSINIPSGHVLTVNKRICSLIIFCRGDVTIDGSIILNGKASLKYNGFPPPIPSGLTPYLLSGGNGGNGGAGGSGAPGGGNEAPVTCSKPGGIRGLALSGSWFGGGWGGAGGGGGGAGSTVGEYSFCNNGYAGKGGDAGDSNINATIGPGGSGGESGHNSTLQPPNYATDGQKGGGFSGGGGGGSIFHQYGCGGGGAGVYGGLGGNAYYTGMDGYAGGSGGGIGGGALILITKGNIKIGSGGAIWANGLNGASGGNGAPQVDPQGLGGGGGGGQGGGGGGCVLIAYKGSFVNSGIISVNGGAGGAGGAGGLCASHQIVYNYKGYPGMAGISGSIGSIGVKQL